MTEHDFEPMRRAMVASQLRTTGVNDPRVVAAMGAVARERFVPDGAARARLCRCVGAARRRPRAQPADGARPAADRGAAERQRAGARDRRRRPAIRRRCWPGWSARWSRSRRMRSCRDRAQAALAGTRRDAREGPARQRAGRKARLMISS